MCEVDGGNQQALPWNGFNPVDLRRNGAVIQTGSYQGNEPLCLCCLSPSSRYSCLISICFLPRAVINPTISKIYSHLLSLLSLDLELDHTLGIYIHPWMKPTGTIGGTCKHSYNFHITYSLILLVVFFYLRVTTLITMLDVPLKMVPSHD